MARTCNLVVCVNFAIASQSEFKVRIIFVFNKSYINFKIREITYSTKLVTKQNFKIGEITYPAISHYVKAGAHDNKIAFMMRPVSTKLNPRKFEA